MPDNVIILGAGASFSAGIPLLRDFMDRIFEIAKLETVNGQDVSKEDCQILEAALRIKNNLKAYNAQVAFDRFDIEDVLSVLSFDALAGEGQAKQDLEAFTKAITKTIDLSCNVGFEKDFNSAKKSGPECYRQFWRSLFKAHQQSGVEMPAIISFNYDLVLERALIQDRQMKDRLREDDLSAEQIVVRYWHRNCKQAVFDIVQGPYTNSAGPPSAIGRYLQPAANVLPNKRPLEIPIIKLHGSLNFPRNERTDKWSIVESLAAPSILPPVFNKATAEVGEEIWKAGLAALRGCKNVIVCGYSLPATDIYMQYFLKAALGPNEDLNRIIVFDPVLFDDSERGTQLRDRYLKCFAPQFKDRINFQPSVTGKFDMKDRGKFEHMVHEFLNRPDALLFGAPAPNDHVIGG